MLGKVRTPYTVSACLASARAVCTLGRTQVYIGTALLLPGVRQVLTVTILGTRCDWANWTGTLSGYSFYCVRFWT